MVRACVRLQGENRLDAQRWEQIQAIKDDLARDDIDRKSVFTRIRDAVAAKEYAAASDLQCDMQRRMEELAALYHLYRRNIELA